MHLSDVIIKGDEVMELTKEKQLFKCINTYFIDNKLTIKEAEDLIDDIKNKIISNQICGGMRDF
jgi:hypothetical protein